MTDATVAPALKPTTPPGTCAVCFFATVIADGRMLCCYEPPGWQRSSQANINPPTTPAGSPYAGLLINWPVVTANDWCGHGYNTVTGKWNTPDGTALP